VVSSEDNISLLAGDNLFANDDCGGSDSSEAVDVTSADELGNITLFERARFIGKGGVVTNNLIDRNASGEGNSTLEVLGLLAVECFLDVLMDHGVNSLADGVDIGTFNQKGKSVLESG
jgi:hypothetical protein